MLILSPEQRELRAAVRSFLAAASPLAKVRQDMESPDGYDRAVYRRLNGELGLSGLIVPEEHGGAGAGHADLAVALEETGAALLPGPLLATVFAAIVLTEAAATYDGQAVKELLPGIAAGTTVATLAPLSGDRGGVTASGGTLTGQIPVAPNGAEADLLLVVARTGEGEALYAVEAGAPGLSRTPLTTLDPTRRQARLTFDGTPARLVATGGLDVNGDAHGHVLARAFDLVSVALAAEQLGVLRAGLDAIVAYSRIRVAFGRQIGSYQAVKHRLADMHCKLEQADAIVRFAAWAADESPGELPEAAALAQAYVGRACFEVARDHLLLHGGVGFTWEHDAHLYYKRAKSDEVLLGPPRTHRARLAELVI
ncbi:acyl-CoA dehydrogenase family protein [Sphaerisporangium perillae]|uniref:acyl-CoA dehydrogenase family protein n=1 Tax=Sphaerisporangium perillae TaxID=2935860 RepID=UPI00200D9AC1|nr:acyl-CoA dehydrogenase family protein [Sphaerisporangium perillae]